MDEKNASRKEDGFRNFLFNDAGDCLALELKARAVCYRDVDCCVVYCVDLAMQAADRDDAVPTLQFRLHVGCRFLAFLRRADDEEPHQQEHQ